MRAVDPVECHGSIQREAFEMAQGGVVLGGIKEKLTITMVTHAADEEGFKINPSDIKWAYIDDHESEKITVKGIWQPSEDSSVEMWGGSRDGAITSAPRGIAGVPHPLIKLPIPGADENGAPAEYYYLAGIDPDHFRWIYKVKR